MTKTIFRYLIVASFAFGLFAGVFDTLFPSAIPGVLAKALAEYNVEALAKDGVLDFSLYALYFISACTANIGLFLFQSWSRRLAVIVTLASFFMNIFLGPSINSGWSAALGDLSTTIWVYILVVAYFSPMAKYFAKTIPVQEEYSPVYAADSGITSSAAIPNTHKLQPLSANIRTGIRALFFLRVKLDENNATWSQLVAIIFINLAILFLGNFAHVGLKGELSMYGLPGALFGLPVILLTAWTITKLANQPNKTLLLLVIFSVIYLPFEAINLFVQWTFDQRLGRVIGYRWNELISYAMITWYALACGVVAIREIGMSVQKRAFVLLLAVFIIGVPTTQIYRSQDLWVQPYDRNEAIERNKKQNLLVSEDVFYLQPKLLERELAAVTKSHKNGIDMFFVGVAGYSSQDVFMKEIQFVSTLFKEQYSTDGHSVMLINNPNTVTQSPIASSTSLRIALNRIGAMMDNKKDILFLYLTSHGSKDHKFSLNFGSMEFNNLDPKRLREILDESGIKRRIIVVSACYSGGFIDALKNDDTLVITSSAADKTSFGCSNEAVLTYFGKAYFEEALHKTNSFIDAFDLAKPVITRREEADGFTPSEPHIFIGDAIKQPLAEFHRQQSAVRIVKAVNTTSRIDTPVSIKPEQVKTVASQGTPVSDRLQSARRLVTLLRYNEMLQGAVKQCKEMANVQSPESLVKADPSYFRGITQESKLWPKVVEAYQNYYIESCSYFDAGTYLASMAAAFASKLTADELASVINFYSSPTGQKLAATNVIVSLELEKAMSAEMYATSEKANVKFTNRIAEISATNVRLNSVEQGKKEPWWKFWESNR